MRIFANRVLSKIHIGVSKNAKGKISLCLILQHAIEAFGGL